MLKNRWLWVGCAVFLIGLTAGTAKANTLPLFSNLDVGGGFYTQSGWLVDGGLEYDEVIANAFTPSQTLTLADAELALGNLVGLDTMTVALESDVSGLPGTVLTTLTQQGSIGPFPPGGLVDYTCAVCPVLQSGVQYWLVAQEPDSSTAQEWNWNVTGDESTTNFAFNQTGSLTGPWTLDVGDPRGAFEVDGKPSSVTPEPASLGLLGLGLAALAFRWRRRAALSQRSRGSVV